MSSSKNSSFPKTGSPPNVSPAVAAEIARLMRDPDALRHEREGTQGPGGRGQYDPNQPRVPAGDPKGGQFASKGGANSGGDVRARASFGGARFAELGQGGPRDAGPQDQPFGGLLGEILTNDGFKSQVGFLRTEHDRETNLKTQARGFQAGHFEFVSTGPIGASELPDGRGYRFTLSSTTYAYDPLTGTHATISATPTRPIEIIEINRKLIIREFGR